LYRKTVDRTVREFAVEDQLSERLNAVPFPFPALTGKNVFVLGLGGGCDVITAYAVSTLLDPSAARTVYGNTKVGNVGPVAEITPHIVRVASTPPEPGHKPQGCGKAAIDHGVPRNEHGSPWIVRLDDETAEAELVGEITSLGLDLILGVDAGGDSIASQGGHGHRGRDQRMLRVLQQTGVPLLHIVVAPGCDGESSVQDLHDAMENHLNSGRYRGRFALEPILPLLRSLSDGLKDSRTPRIILRAADGVLTRTSTDQFIVPRGCQPAVPVSWLLHAYVFEPGPSLKKSRVS
jgi:hypothetical protein